MGVGADLWHQFETLFNNLDVMGAGSLFAEARYDRLPRNAESMWCWVNGS